MFVRKPDTSSFGKILGELLLIIIGINIALWFEGRFEDMREAKTERQYLIGLAADLETDLSQFDDVIKLSRRKIERLQVASQELNTLVDESNDRQAEIIFMPSSYLFFEPADFTYESMQESGDFQLLSEPQVKSGILRLVRRYRQIDQLQKNFLSALDSEYIPLIMARFDISAGTVTDPALMRDQMFLNFFTYTLQDTDAMLQAYTGTREMAASLQSDIQAQLDK